MKKLLLSLFAVALVICGALTWLWIAHGQYGFETLFRRGGSYWISMAPTDERLTPSMRLALADPLPDATPGPITWQQAEPGF